MPSILIKYSPELSTNVKYIEWDTENFKSLVENVCSFFPELEQQNILIYFTHHYEIVDNAIATMFPLSYPNSMLWEYEDLATECSLITNLNFAIYMRPEIFDLDNIGLVINIGHEFHHISQYIKNEKIYFFGKIVSYYLYDVLPEQKHPLEYDAEKASKAVAYSLFGEEKVNQWIELYALKYKHVFFEIFRDIDVTLNFDLATEVLNKWKGLKIEERVKELKTIDKRDDDEKIIIGMYDYANNISSD